MEGALGAYGAMRSAMMDLEFEKAKSISDSLVEADPTWATAHLGQLQYYWMKRDVENLNRTREIAEAKLGSASRAEAHFIKSVTSTRDMTILQSFYRSNQFSLDIERQAGRDPVGVKFCGT